MVVGARQEVFSTANIVPSLRKQSGMDAGTQLAFSFFMPSWTPAQEMVLSTFRVGGTS